MKKIIYLSMLMFLSTSTFLGQDITYGLKAGPNFAKAHSSESEFNDEIEMRTAFHIGGVVEFSFSEQFSLQTELLYSATGYKWSYESGMMFTRSIPSVTVENTYKLDYLSIPILAKYYVTKEFNLQAGPQVGFLLAAKGESKAEGETETEDIKDDIESFDFGIGFGLGYKMENGIFADARYLLGLSNFAKDTEGDFTIKNNVIQVSVGYMF